MASKKIVKLFRGLAALALLVVLVRPWDGAARGDGLAAAHGSAGAPAGGGSFSLAQRPLSQAGGITVEAVDNDQENTAYICDQPDVRVPFGNEDSDRVRCWSFRYQVPAGGVTSATLHVAVKPLGGLQDTDSMAFMITPKSAGTEKLVTLHGGFRDGEFSVDLDLFNLTCDPTVTATPEDQQAVIDRLQTGVVHMVLQDDTAVMRAQLILNGGPLTVPCGQSSRPGAGTSQGATSGSSGGNTSGSTAGGVTNSTGGTSFSPPPFGTPEPIATDRMTLQAGQRRVFAGQYVEIPVYLINAGNVANMNFTISYSPAVAEPDSELYPGYLLGGRMFTSNIAEFSLIQAGFAGTSGISGTGPVAYVPFIATGNPGDRTELRLDVSTINDPNGASLAIDLVPGMIEIVGPDGLPEGDCNGDGRLNEVDALCALRMSVNLIPSLASLDVDSTGDVTSRDATIILQRARRGQ